MNRHAHVVTGARIAHDEAAVCDLEAARRESEAALLAELRADPAVEEAFALQTCHRVEAYVVASSVDEGHAALESAGFGAENAVAMDHEGSIRHLMRVAAGLESMVVGEDQILGQVKGAFELAKDSDAVGPLLEEAVPKALRVGERARTETAINEGVVSLGSAAVRLAEREYGLDGVTATVVGMGEMGVLTGKALAEGPIERLLVANRTVENAASMVRLHDLDATVVPLDELPAHLAESDVVVTATSAPTPIVDVETVAGAGPTYVIDLGQPRNVAPSVGDLEDVTLRDLDDLTAVTDETRERRARAAAEVEAIIDDEFDRLVTQFKRKQADEVIAAMYEGADRIKARELQTATSKLESAGRDLTDEERAVLERFADSVVSQLLAAPTRALRDAAEDDDWSTIATAIRLFDPEFDADVIATGLFPAPSSGEGPATVSTETEDD